VKQIIASVFFDILSFTIGNIILCIFKNFEIIFIIITVVFYLNLFLTYVLAPEYKYKEYNNINNDFLIN